MRSQVSGIEAARRGSGARLRRFRVAAIIPNAEACEQFNGETTAHLFAIHVQLLIHCKRLTIPDCGLRSLTSVRNAL